MSDFARCNGINNSINLFRGDLSLRKFVCQKGANKSLNLRLLNFYGYRRND